MSDRIRAAMAERELTQQDIAKIIGHNQPTISKRLRGITPWTIHELMELAEAFGTTVSYLLGEVDKP